MASPLVINWNPDPVLFSIGSVDVRYYGLLWIVGIACSYFIVRKVYIDQKIGEKKFDPLFFYCFVGMIAGARLGHCLFYEPDYFLHHISEIFLPVRFLPDGSWKFIGYRGLASHGGTIGLMITLMLYCKRYKMHIIDVFDIISIATPVCACCIRLANLMNSEIIGKATDATWAFVFLQVDNVPRHPAQLYEALFYLLLGIVMWGIYKKRGLGVKRGFYFGMCLTVIFAFRFFVEFLKEDQVAFEENMTWNMGQLLSIPFVLVGIYFMFFFGRNSKRDIGETVTTNNKK